MAKPSMEKYLGDVLNHRRPVIRELADLPFLLRITPLAASDSSHPGELTQEMLLAMYIDMADTTPWAREGLRRLVQEKLANDEPVPELLIPWVLHQFVRGDPPPKPGRPKESDRDFRVLSVFSVLREQGWTSEAAMGDIADLMDYAPETIRSIIRKYRPADLLFR